jgi:hypothetical protein
MDLYEKMNKFIINELITAKIVTMHIDMDGRTLTQMEYKMFYTYELVFFYFFFFFIKTGRIIIYCNSIKYNSVTLRNIIVITTDMRSKQCILNFRLYATIRKLLLPKHF